MALCGPAVHRNGLAFRLYVGNRIAAGSGRRDLLKEPDSGPVRKRNASRSHVGAPASYNTGIPETAEIFISQIVW